jgi:hypothetical protein
LLQDALTRPVRSHGHRLESCSRPLREGGVRRHVFIAVDSPTCVFPGFSTKADAVEHHISSNEYDKVIYLQDKYSVLSWVVSSCFQSSEPSRRSLSCSLNPLESAHPKNAPVTPPESALTKWLNLKSFGIRTYEKSGEREGHELLTSFPVQQATERSSSRRCAAAVRSAFKL